MTAPLLAWALACAAYLSGRYNGDDLTGDRRAGTFDSSVSGKQCSVVPFGGSDVDRVGIAQRRLHEHPGAMHVAPQGCFDLDPERLRVLQGLPQVGLPQGMVGAVRGGPESRHDLEREVPRRD